MSLGTARPGVRILDRADLRVLAAELPLVPAIVGLLTVAAFVLYLSQVHQSLFADELYTYGETVHHSFTGMLHTVGTSVEVSPPLFFVLAWFSVKLGDPTVWIRLPSLILGAGTIPVIYLLGRETVGRAAAVIGAAAFAASPFALFYGVQARPYATAAFFTVLSTYALVRAVRGAERRWWALYAVAAAAAAYSHYTTVFVLVVQAAWAMWACRARWRRPLIANVAVVLMYLPWLPYLHGGHQLVEYGVIESFTTRHVLQDLVRFVVGYPFAPLHAIPTVAGFAAIAVAVLLGVLWRARRYSERAHVDYDSSRGGLPLMVALALATAIGVLVSSMVGTDIWYADHLYASAPAAALVLGALFVAIPRRPRAVATTVVLGVLVFGTIRGLSPSWRRPQYRAVAQYLDRMAKPRDPVVLFTEPVVFDAAIQVQLKRRHTIIDDVVRWWRRRRPAGTLAFVVVDDDEFSRFGRALEPPGYALVTRRRYSGLIDFTLFTYRAV